jgi:hypothetical protein
MTSEAGYLLPCALSVLLLAGCDEQEGEPPRPSPITSLSDLAKPKPKSKDGTTNDANLSPEEVRIKQLEMLKAAQEKAIKAQEAQLRKQKKKESKDGKDDGGKAGPVSSGSNTKLIEVARPKEGHDKEKVKTAQEGRKRGSSLVEITSPDKAKVRTVGDNASLAGENTGKLIEPGGIATETRPGQPEKEKRGFFDRLFGKDKPAPRTVQAAPPGEDMKISAPVAKKHADSQPLKRVTPEMASVLGAVDEMQKRSRETAPSRASPQHHDTMTNRVQQEIGRAHV